MLMDTTAFKISNQRKVEGKYEITQVIDPNYLEHKHLIDEKVHEESYQRED